MNCYFCGGEAEQIPFEEIVQESKKIVGDNYTGDEECKNLVIGTAALLASGSYGRWRCKDCKMLLSAMELIGRNLCSVQPMPPGAVPKYFN